MKLQKHWYLGFIGIVGIWQFSHAIGPFFGHGTWWDATSLLWFLWFAYFIPEDADATDNPEETQK